MNVFSINVCDSIFCVISLPFTTPLPWPHGIVKCPLNAHCRILSDVLGHPFWQLFHKYCDFRHTLCTCCIDWKYAYSDATRMCMFFVVLTSSVVNLFDCKVQQKSQKTILITPKKAFDI